MRSLGPACALACALITPASADEPEELAGETIEIVEEAPVATAAPPAEKVAGDDIRVLPGARGDAIEAVRNLPGVAFASSGRGSTGDLAIRGTSGSDSWYLIDGIAVPAVTHLGAATAVLPVELIGSVELQPGGFDTAYGRATGGVIELATRPGRGDRWRGAAEVSFIHASVYAEGPLWKDRVTAIAGVRRSFLDAVMPVVLPDDAGLTFTQAPTYSDAQLRIDARIAPRHLVTLLGLYSDDRVATVLEEETATDPLFTGFSSTDRFWRAALTWSYDGPRAGARAIASIGTDDETLRFGAAHFLGVGATVATGRADVRVPLGKRAALRGGVDGQVGVADLAGRLPVGSNEGSPDPNLTLDPALELEDRITVPMIAAYVAADLRPIERLALTPGVRVDRFGVIDDTVVQPRLAGELELADRWFARGSAGLFARTHDQAKTIAEQLAAERSKQLALGVEHRGPGIKLAATAFASWLDRLAVFDPAMATPDDPLAGYVSRGTGTARGVELSAELRRDDLFAWFAYTFSQSRRTDAPGLSERVFDDDQPHNLVAAASWKRGRWRFGARFRLASGTPDTPIIGAVYVADHDVYRPVYGPANSTRMPSTHQLDVRVDRHFTLGAAKLSAYLDIANVYANPRVEGFSYDFDYRNREEVADIPFLPSIGLRGEL